MSATRSGRHPEIAPELRALAQSILDRLEPAVRLAALRSAAGAARCEQLWCPVCALAALVTGEQHPLLTVIAEHSGTLLAAVRTLADGSAASAAPQATDPRSTTGSGSSPAGTPPTAPQAPEPPPETTPPASEPGRYQHIPVTVES